MAGGTISNKIARKRRGRPRFRPSKLAVPSGAMDLPLNELPMSVRMERILRRRGCHRLGDLDGVDSLDLLDIRGFGRTCIRELTDLLRRVEEGEFTTAAPDGDVGVALRRAVSAIDRGLEQVPGRFREIFEARLGRDAGGPRALSDVGDEFRVCRERVRQIVQVVSEKLRRSGGPPLLQALEAIAHECKERGCSLTSEIFAQWHGGEAGREAGFYVEVLMGLEPAISAETPSPIWAYSEAAWDRRYKELKVFRERFGHCRVPFEWAENPPLASWAAKQRRQIGLSAERRARLDALGFDWGSFAEAQWQAGFRKLVAFRRLYGHCRVPVHWLEDPWLGHWVGEQRAHKKRLSEEQRVRLEALGFEWRVRERGKEASLPPRLSWRIAYQRLRQFHAEHGHLRLSRPLPDTWVLRKWIALQKRGHASLGPGRIEKLAGLGITFGTWTDWYRRFFELRRWAQEHGRLPAARECESALRQWMAFQRCQRTNGILDSRRIEWLDALGFDWNPPKSLPFPTPVRLDLPAEPCRSEGGRAWEAGYERLLRLRTEEGGLRLSPQTPDLCQILEWIVRQQTGHASLTEEQIRKLLDLGVTFGHVETAWYKSFFDLREFLLVHGRFPRLDRGAREKRLARWVGYQRQRRRKGQLPPSQVQRLNGLRIEWRPAGRHLE